MRGKIPIKTPEEMKMMQEGGKKLARIKKGLRKIVAQGKSAAQVEEAAIKLINEAKAEASFKKVPGYHWATCINVNSGLVHGIPKKEVIFKKGDVVSVDTGIFYKGFHTDTSFSVGIAPSNETERFLKAGQEALAKAVNEATEGNRVYDISYAIDSVIRSYGYTPVRALVGHGVGRDLHEPPQIPCFVQGEREDSPAIKTGMVFAIEVMYAMGDSEVVLSEDGWTISMADGKISALFEETVGVTSHGPLVLTEE